MTSHPDKLFRDGLGNYHNPAPSSAWERIEARLDHKRKLSPWLKIAAGLLLVLATSILIWQQNQRVSNGQFAVGSSQSAIGKEQGAVSKERMAAESRQSSVVSRQSEINLESSVARREAATDNQESSAVNQKSSVVSRQLSDSHQELANVSQETTIGSMVETDEQMTEPVPQTYTEGKNDISANAIVQEQKGINMMYTAEEVNEKFLKKEPTPDATPEKKNTSGFQKVIAVALDLKYEEPLVGELRDKKNEWLSINASPKKRELNK